MRLHGQLDDGVFVDQAIETIRAQVGDGRVICALSGGVDSAVVAALVHRAIGDQLTCIFVDNGLLRRGEPQRVVETFEQHLGMRLVHVDAVDSFLGRLAGVTDPEEKRRIVGDEFIRIFAQEARKLGHIDFLAQGTLYPDVIESTSHDTASAASRIKTHHNVGPAREPAVPTDRAAALPVQGRSARSRRRAGAARRDRLAPSVPGPRPRASA